MEKGGSGCEEMRMPAHQLLGRQPLSRRSGLSFLLAATASSAEVITAPFPQALTPGGIGAGNTVRSTVPDAVIT
jgi:hypothetical protein